jgi:hypothetical protein
MRIKIVFILVINIHSCLFSQEPTEKGAYMRIGPQIGIMLNGQNSPQSYSVDIFTNSRMMSFNMEGGIGFYLNESNRLELNGSIGFFGLRKKKYKEEVLIRSDQYFIYDDFELDETNSTGNSLKDFKLIIDYVYDIEINKWKLSPNIGFGIRYMNHRDYQFVLREKNSNQFIEYNLTSHAKPDFNYRAGIRFHHKRWPYSEWYLSLTGGQINYSYSIQKVDQIPIHDPVDVRYGKHLIVISVGLKLINPFSMFKSNH